MVAEEIGRYAREYARRKVSIPTQITIRLPNGRKFSEGTARIKDISLKGALLSNIKVKRNVIPAGKFYIELSFKSRKYSGVHARCMPVRFGTGRSFELGVKFVDLWAEV
jgi:hypothetical protein